jgi:hypothetical protein
MPYPMRNVRGHTRPMKTIKHVAGIVRYVRAKLPLSYQTENEE